MPDLQERLKSSSIYQRFSLPEALVFYMAQNPLSPKLYHKLIRCCKYFWLKSSIITLHSLHRPDGSSQYDKFWKAFKINGFYVFQKFKIDNVNEKYWFYQKMFIEDKHDQFLASSIVPRIYRCDLIRLELFYQILSFDEFQKFTSSVLLRILYLHKTIVKNEDGTIVPIEKLMKLLPNLQTFYYGNVSGDDGLQTITSETAANLNTNPHFSQMESFYMYGIPESFDIDAFFATPKVRTSIFS